MKMNSTQIGRILHQLDAEAIPLEHPAMAQLERLFGEHTYFLDGDGLNIVEPVEAGSNDLRQGMVVNLARWTDGKAEALQPHAPEATGKVVDLDDSRH